MTTWTAHDILEEAERFPKAHEQEYLQAALIAEVRNIWCATPASTPNEKANLPPPKRVSFKCRCGDLHEFICCHCDGLHGGV